MATLYELSATYEELMDYLYDEEWDPEKLIDTLDGIEGEIEEKAENYAKIMKQMDLDIAGCKAEEARLATKRKSLENREERLKNALYEAMKAVGKPKFKTALFSFNIQKNPASLVIDKPDEIPEEFLIPQAPKVDNVKIKDVLKTGEVLPYAHLVQGESLRIR